MTAPPDTSDNQDRFDHTFPGPGSYEVTATITGTNAKTRSWTDTIVINPAAEGLGHPGDEGSWRRRPVRSGPPAVPAS